MRIFSSFTSPCIIDLECKYSITETTCFKINDACLSVSLTDFSINLAFKKKNYSNKSSGDFGLIVFGICV